MKTLDEQITDAENALEQAKTSGDAGAQAKAEGCLEGLKNAKEFHTKEFERVGKKIRSEGGSAREQEIAEEFGVTIAEAKEIIAEYNASQEALATEADKERTAREAAEKERDEARAATDAANKLANERLIKSKLELKLVSGGAREDRLTKILRDADLSEVEIEDEEVKNLDPVVTKLKEEYPEWFGAEHERLIRTPEGSSGDRNPAQELSKQRRKNLPSILRPGAS